MYEHFLDNKNITKPQQKNHDKKNSQNKVQYANKAFKLRNKYNLQEVLIQCSY